MQRLIISLKIYHNAVFNCNMLLIMFRPVEIKRYHCCIRLYKSPASSNARWEFPDFFTGDGLLLTSTKKAYYMTTRKEPRQWSIAQLKKTNKGIGDLRCKIKPTSGYSTTYAWKMFPFEIIWWRQLQKKSQRCHSLTSRWLVLFEISCSRQKWQKPKKITGGVVKLIVIATYQTLCNMFSAFSSFFSFRL